MASKKDVGLIEDSCYALSNLVSIENHCLFSYLNTKEEKWLDVLNLIRKKRTILLDRIVKKENSQLYCVSKHLLASSMGISEVANRYLEKGEKEFAKELYEFSGDCYALILLLNDYTKGGKNDTK